jgi:sugar phosphate permease
VTTSSTADPMESSQTEQLSLRPWFIWGVAALFFFCGYFLRVSPSVMVSFIARDLHLGAEGLGTLSSFFYWPYILMQLPVGVLVDRYSTRYLLAGMVLLTAISCYLFATMHTVFQGELARFTAGFAVAFSFVGALKLAASWFPPRKIGLLAGLTQALGMLGAFVGEAPVAFSVERWGWRATTLGMGLVFVALALAILMIVRDKHEPSEVQSGGLLAGLKVVLTNPQTWLNGLYAGFIFAPMAAFSEFWGVSYLTHVQQLPLEEAAGAIGMIFLGWGIGGPFIGWLTDCLGKRRPMMMASAILSLITFSMVLYAPGLTGWQVFTLLFVFGLVNSGLVVSYAMATEINPHAVAGTSLAFANMCSVIIGALLQPVLGWLMQTMAGPHLLVSSGAATVSAYQSAMIILPISLVLAFVFAVLVRETYCKPRDFH